MAIVALGMDLVRIERVEDVLARRGARFLERVFTAGERAYCDARRERATHYAGRFAVKEAAMKALGTGCAAAEIARARGIARLHVTITHDAGLAAAVVVAES